MQTQTLADLPKGKRGAVIHAARLSSSPRLQRVYRLLEGGDEHSTLDIVQKARVCAVNSIISELRLNGCTIGCRMEVDGEGKRVWFYRLLEGVS